MILAGGRGSRMGGVDKGWVELDAKPLIARAIERFGPQVDELFISANRALERYETLGYPVVRDEVPGFAGPLAGVHAALKIARSEWLASCPCDSPWLPLDLVARLYRACVTHAARVSVARSASGPHPVFALVQRAALPALEDYLQSGGRRVGEWYRSMPHVEVEFEDEAAFANLNTLEDLARPPSA